MLRAAGILLLGAILLLVLNWPSDVAPAPGRAPADASPGTPPRRRVDPPRAPTDAPRGHDESGGSPSVVADKPSPAPLSLTVHVLDSGGAPAPGAAVTVYDVFATEPDRAVVARGATDAGGYARFGLRDVVDVLIHAMHRGEAAATKASLFRATEAQAEVRLAPAATVRGVVLFDDDVPVAGADVLAFLENRTGTLVLSASSGADGRFTLDAVPPDRLERAPRLRAVRGRGHWGGEVQPTIEEARSSVVVLRVDRTTIVRGRCVDDLGRAVPRAVVTVYTEKWNWMTRSDAEGRFEGEFPRGRGFAEFVSDATLDTRVEPFVVDGPALDLGDVVLPRGATIRGIALDRNGDPVPRASVQVTGARRALYARTNDDGRFEVEHLAPPGPYDVLVQAQADSEERGAPEADAGEVRGVAAPFDGVTVRLGGSRFVSVRLRRPEGRRGGLGFTLKIQGESGRALPDTHRRAGGPSEELVRFRLPAPGRYDLVLESAEFAPVSFKEVRVDEGSETFLEAALLPK